MIDEKIDILKQKLLALRNTFNESITVPLSGEEKDAAHYISFYLEQEVFAWPANYIQEILVNRKIVPIPEDVKNLYGVVNYKNQVVPVVNLHQALSLRRPDISDQNTIMITKGLQLESAILVDRLFQILKINDSEILPKPISLDHLSGELILGEIYYDKKMVIVLNPDGISSI